MPDGNLARGDGNGLGAGAHLADDRHQAVVHVFQRLHQLADFIRRVDVDVLRQIAFGNGTRQLHRLVQRTHDGTNQGKTQPCRQGQANDDRNDGKVANAYAAVMCLVEFLLGDRALQLDQLEQGFTRSGKFRAGIAGGVFLGCGKVSAFHRQLQGDVARCLIGFPLGVERIRQLLFFRDERGAHVFCPELVDFPVQHRRFRIGGFGHARHARIGRNYCIGAGTISHVNDEAKIHQRNRAVLVNGFDPLPVFTDPIQADGCAPQQHDGHKGHDEDQTCLDAQVLKHLKLPVSSDSQY